jgi:uncharacterized protein YjdB
MKSRSILSIVLAVILTLAMAAVACTTAATPPGPTLTSIAISPSSPPHLLVGATQQFTATGTYSDNTTKDITSEVTWASSNTAVASINADGLATGIAPGATYISVVESTAASAVALVVVAPTPQVTLVSIAVSAPKNLVVGDTRQLIATGTYSDGTTADITSTVTWASSDTSVATISASGLVAGVAAGTTNITASMAGVTSPVVVLNMVAPAIPASITIQPSLPINLDVGATLDLTAFGTYSDGSIADITFLVIWASSNTGTATISSTGTVTAVASGTTNITASLYGVMSQPLVITVD